MKAFTLCFALLCVCGAISGATMAGAPRHITDEMELKKLTKKVGHYLMEFNKQGFGAHLELMRTRSATVQVVAGVMYKMMVDMMENQQESQCKIALWEKSWENFAKLDIECGNGERKYSFVTEHKEMTDEVQFDEMHSHMGHMMPVTDREELADLEMNMTRYFKEFSAQGMVHFELNEIESARVQMMPEGAMRYVVMVDLMENKHSAECQVMLMQKPMMNYVKMDVACGEHMYSFVTVHEEHYSEHQFDTIRETTKKITNRKELAMLFTKVNTYLKEFTANGFVHLKMMEIKTATEKMMMNGMMYVIMGNMMENDQESHCKVTLFTKTEHKKSIKLDVECGNGKRKYSFARSMMMDH